MKYIELQSAVWKISERDYKKLLKEIEKTGAVEDLDKYGKMIIFELTPLSDLLEP